MSKKNMWIWIGVGIVVLVIVVWLSFDLGKNSATDMSENSNFNPATVTSTQASPSATATVLGVGAQVSSTNIAVPSIVSAASPTGGANYRSFALSANKNTFTPNIINVNQGDTINIEMTAVDKNYDFTQPDYGLNEIQVLKGTTKQIQFEATASGQFTFYCASCGGPSSTAVGYITIVPKQ